MANIKSAKKRILVAEKRAEKNKSVRSRVKTAVKKVDAAIAANAGLGNNIVARDHAAQAVNMEPNNQRYCQLLNQLSWNSRRYQNNPYGGGYGTGSPTCGTGNFCCDLWCADTLCECMGGDLCSCM